MRTTDGDRATLLSEVRVRGFSPRPSARIASLGDPAERATAMDFDVFLEADVPVAGSTGVARRIVAEAEVTLWQTPQGTWRPCDSCQIGQVGGSWIHSWDLWPFLEHAKRHAGPLADEIARRVLGALSGNDGPAGPLFSWVAQIDLQGRGALSPGTILPGDVVRHRPTARFGIVGSIGATDRLGTTTYQIGLCADPIRPAGLDAPSDVGSFGEAWWTSDDVTRVPHADPYRRYLAMRAVEDDPGHQARRIQRQRLRRERRDGADRGVLPAAAWDRAYWRLCHLQRRAPDGRWSYRPLGRAHWRDAAIDCLARRDRADDLARTP